MKSLLRVGILGIGHWGSNIVRNFIRHPRVQVTHLCDVSKSALAQAAKTAPPGCLLVSDPSIVFDSSMVDAVVVITPATTHYQLTKAALQAGKHVYCEKPLALNLGETEDLCDLSEKMDRRLMVGFTFLFNNGIKKIKEFLEAGSLGEIYYLTSIRTHLGLIREDVSSLWDLAPHDISIMNYLLGSNPEKVSAVGSNPLGSNHADFGFISLFYPGNIVGQIHVSWLNSSKERVLKVIGSKAKIEFDDLNMLEPVRFFEKGIGFADHIEPDFGAYKYLLRDGNIISPKIEMREPLGEMTDAFVRLVMDNEKNISDGLFALDVTRALVAAHQSMVEHGVPRDLP